jgi:hypothetical protein
VLHRHAKATGVSHWSSAPKGSVDTWFQLCHALGSLLSRLHWLSQGVRVDSKNWGWLWLILLPGTWRCGSWSTCQPINYHVNHHAHLYHMRKKCHVLQLRVSWLEAHYMCLRHASSVRDIPPLILCVCVCVMSTHQSSMATRFMYCTHALH